jgi:hypothetical protein
MELSIDSMWCSTNFMNKFTSIEPASLYFSNCNPAYLLDTSHFYQVTEHICAFANILIVTHVGGAGWRLCHCRWRGRILSTCWLYHHFAGLPTVGSIAPWKSDMTFALVAIASVPGSQSESYYAKVRKRNHDIPQSTQAAFTLILFYKIIKMRGNARNIFISHFFFINSTLW